MKNKNLSIINFLSYICSNDEDDDYYVLVFGNFVYLAKLLFHGEDENDFNEDDPRYEEYYTLAFENDTGVVFEVNYKKMPDKVYFQNKLIFEKQNGILIKID